MSATAVLNVGFIGIGNMGWPMAANIHKAGHVVVVLDSVPGRAGEFAAAHPGARAAAQPADLAGVQFVVTMLPTGPIVRQVLLDGGVAAALAPGTLVIDMSSSEPTGTRELGAVLAQQGLTLIDAPVSGAVPRATTGTLAIMIGADDEAARERAKPLLRCMGDRLFDTGALGTGDAMKGLNNFVAAAGYSAAVEALMAGKRFGLDPTRMLEIMNVSTGRNFNTEVVLQEHVVNARYASGFGLGLLAKDVKIAADLMKDVNLDAPLAQLLARRYEQARDQLGFGRDNTEALKAWDNDLAPRG